MRGYLGGLFDGEGCISRAGGRLRLQIAMTDESVIRWLLATTSAGTVRERNVKGNRKRCWIWIVARQHDVRAVLLAMRPYLIVKAEAADAALVEIDELLDAAVLRIAA